MSELLFAAAGLIVLTVAAGRVVHERGLGS